MGSRFSAARSWTVSRSNGTTGPDSLLLSRGKFSRKLEQRGEAPAGMCTFAILQAQSPEVTWRGMRVTEQMMMVYPPGAEIDAVSLPGFDVFTFSIPVGMLRSWDQLSQLNGGKKIRPMCMVASASEDMLNRL